MGNRQALITGGTKGIGAAVARRLVREGDQVLLTYSSDDEAALATQRDLQELNPDISVQIVRADATDLTSIDVLVDAVAALQAPLDVLILNAGITDRSPFHEMELDAWRRVFDANVHFPTFLIQRLLPHFADGASVVLTGSLMGIHPHSVSLSYGVTKATGHALVKNLVKFLSPRGIRINAVAPGFVDTEWQKTKPAEIRASINSKIALGRFCDPDELADAYLTLIDNTYLNGEILTIDGGYSYR